MFASDNNFESPLPVEIGIVLPSRNRLMQMLLFSDLDVLRVVDKSLMEALDASDRGDVVRAEYLFNQTLGAIQSRVVGDNSLTLYALSYYCDFLRKNNRLSKHSQAFRDLSRLRILYNC